MAWFATFAVLMVVAGAWMVYCDIQARREARAELKEVA